jgi:XTP/dITP diphosphohydrolase
MLKLCFATNNAHKIEEIQALLGEKFDIQTLHEIGCEEDLAETQTTLEGNSLQKAQYIWQKYAINCFADDSGLEVDVLGGEPGVYSARYAGEQRNHADNMAKLLENLAIFENKKAQFRAVITLILNGEIHQFEGKIRGKIINEKLGSKGFGYDPIFVPDGYNRTFAEMDIAEKNPISHRGLAVQKLVDFLAKKNQF